MSVTRLKARISSCSIANITFQSFVKARAINLENHFITVCFLDDDQRMEIFTLGPFFSHQELGESIAFINKFIENDYTCKNRQ